MRSLIVIDNFYPNPKAIRKKALSMEFVEPDNLIGWRTAQGYFPNNFIALLQDKTGLTIEHIKMPEGTPYDNGTYYLAFNSGEKKEDPWIHWDAPASNYICLVFLTENVPITSGTSFFRHRKTGAEFGPTAKYAKQLGVSKKYLKDILSRDGTYRKRFIETDKVGYRFNRAVIFPANRLHSASEHFGNNVNNGRIFQGFVFKAN